MFAAKKAPVSASLPETLRSKLVTRCGEVDQPGLLKRSSTDDLVRPGQLLGKGTFGVVRLRHNKNTGEPMAVKTMDKPEHWNRARLVHEACVLQNLDHPHIARIFKWHDDTNSITMVIEFCAGGELLDAVGMARRAGETMRENWATLIFKQLFEAMSYCHARGLVHMDIKSGNILLLHAPEPDIRGLFKTSPHAVLSDLGLAIVLDPNSSWFRRKLAGDAKGTPATMAPEVWKGDIGPKADMWGLGCILYELFCACLPYMPADPQDRRQQTWERLYRQAGEEARQRLEVCDCSQEVKDLCMAILSVDVQLRPSSKECLASPWFARFLPARPLDDSQMCNVKLLGDAVIRWTRLSPMYRALRLKLASESRSVAKFASAFAMFDADHNGVLSRTELISALQKMGIADHMANDAAQSLDFQNRNVCEYLEFAAACLSSLGKEYDEILLNEWTQLDDLGAGDGKLGMASFRRLLERLKPICDNQQFSLEAFFSGFGKGRDGLISFADFACALGSKTYAKEEERPSPERVPVQTVQKRAEIQYFSASHSRWIDTTILNRDQNGLLEISVKPEYMMSLDEQRQKLRYSDGTAFEPELPAASRELKEAQVTTRRKPAAVPVPKTKAVPPKRVRRVSRKHTGQAVKAELAEADKESSVPESDIDEFRKDPSLDPAPQAKCTRRSQTDWCMAYGIDAEELLPHVPSSAKAQIQKVAERRQGPFGPMSGSSTSPRAFFDVESHRVADGLPPPPAIGFQRSGVTSTKAPAPKGATGARLENGLAFAHSQIPPAPPSAETPAAAKTETSAQSKAKAMAAGQTPSATKTSSPKAKAASSTSTGGARSPSESVGSGKALINKSLEPEGPKRSKFDPVANDAALDEALKRLEAAQQQSFDSASIARANTSKGTSLLHKFSALKQQGMKRLTTPADEWIRRVAKSDDVGRPIIVLDWDDTIVPTTFIQAEVLSGGPLHNLVEVKKGSGLYNDFLKHATAVEAFMRACKKVAHVVVLTLASRWWISASIEKYFFGVDMRALMEELDIIVYHADCEAQNVQEAAKNGGRAQLVAKRTAFSACLKEFYGTDSVLWNVMSIGDAMIEHDALKAVLEVEANSENSRLLGKPLCKTVKLPESPLLHELTSQLEMLLPTIEVMATYDKSFHRVVDITKCQSPQQSFTLRPG